MKKLKTAFLHYHLKTGGVTTVIKHQAEALKNKAEVMVIAGEADKNDFSFHLCLIPGIGYESKIKQAKNADPEKSADAICEAIYKKWPSGCDILHVHNATLNKNSNFLKILKILQKRSIRLFIQIHDFAEDGRPAACFKEDYPENCHYGVINSRDYDILLKAGLKKQGLHKIPNRVSFLNTDKTKIRDNIVVYPVRAIRRKNIGEAIFLSLFFRQGETLAITQPPNSPADIFAYNDWKKFVKKRGIKVIFEAGNKMDFKKLIASSKFIITTSITEGFGFSFLEPWTGGKFLFGRKLADICIDFEKKGIDLSHMYESLKIPADWIDMEKFYSKWRACMLKIIEAFDFHIDSHKTEEIFSNMAADNLVDFGLLNERFQQDVIQKLMDNPLDKKILEDINPFLKNSGRWPDMREKTEKNAKAVMENFGDYDYGSLLTDIYKKVIDNPINQKIDKKALFKCFFKPERFSLLKWCAYD